MSAMKTRAHCRLSECPEYAKSAESERTPALVCLSEKRQDTTASRKLKPHDSSIGMQDVSETTHTPGKPQDGVSAVLHHPCSHVEEPVPQRLEQLFLVQTGQGKPLHPVDDVVGEHPDGEIGPVGVKLLTGEPVKRQP